MLGRDRLLQRCLTLLQRGVFFGLGAIHALLLSELLQRLIACQDRALLLQDSLVVSHAALVHGQLLVHFQQFVLHLLQTTCHIVRALTLQFQGTLTLPQLLQVLLRRLQLLLQVHQGVLVGPDSCGQLLFPCHVLLQLGETLGEGFDVLVHLIAVRSGTRFQRIVD